MAKNLPDTAKKSLQRRFEPLHRLLDDNNGPAADLTPLLQALNELQLQLAGLRAPASRSRRLSTWRRAAWAASAMP
ncbi:hypothetical protein P4200_21190 [Pseudomonas aeruginosa]|nr:hypothetical protein [Pseudomonas aeruginosa]